MVKAQKGSIKRHGSHAGNRNTRQFIKKANVDGYAKRQSRKSKPLSNSASDVYEYIPDSTRRSNVALDLDRDEALEYNRDDNAGNEAPEDFRARLVGESGEKETIDSGEDEEIDSDEAFEESDEDRFAGFFSSKKKKRPFKKRRPALKSADVDLNEDESGGTSHSESEEGGEDDDFYDVLDILDGRAAIDRSSDAEPPNKKFGSEKDHERVEEESEGEESDDQMNDSEDGNESTREQESRAEQEFAVSASESEDVGPQALEDLQNFVTGLDPITKKRKVAENDPLDSIGRSRKQRRLPLKERTEAGAENEFHAQTSGSKLNLDDLLAPLSSQPSTLQSLKQSTKALDPSSTKVMTLPAPLPQRAQERLDREAAYQQTKEEVDKWSETMKRIREADHISFPLQAPTAGRISNLELAAKFKPTTVLESSVDALLKTAKLREEDIEKTEDTMLKMNKLSVEEVAQRRMELRKMRELMFRAEIKAKRINKIKSKTYRKLKRKEREKLGGKLADGEEGEEGEDERMKREVERAKERATLRHKHTGKWAKKMRGREGLGEEGREAIEEMLDRSERLRRKIKGVDSDEESDEEEEADDAERDVDKIKQNAFDELRQADLEDDALRIEAVGKDKGKSVFGMKFMKDAMARQQRATDDMARDFANEIEGLVHDSEASIADETQTPDAINGTTTQRIGGRVSYHPTDAAKTQSATTRPFRSLPSDTSSVTLKSTDLLSPPQSPLEFHIAPSSTIVPLNPWLTSQNPDSRPARVAKKKNTVVVGKDSSVLSKSRNKIKKATEKGAEERSRALEDAVVEISTESVLALASTPTQNLPPRSLHVHTTEVRNEDSLGAVENGVDDDDANSEVLDQETALTSKRAGQGALPHAFKQRDLVALAFAGDDVVQAFEETKKREIAADAPREVDTTIPGWGAWGGAGLQKPPPKPQRIKKIAGIDPASRADYKKAHVIISEKRDKKAAKYLVKDLPYPYTSKAQFEKTMERPLGTEWNTRVSFQKGTLPRVTKKPGMIISPLEKL